MELTDALRIPLGPSAVWDALTDTALLRASLENCESFGRLPSGEYTLTLTVPVGPLRARYEVRTHLASLEAATEAGSDSAASLHRTLNFKACATGVGSLRGQIDIALAPDNTVQPQSDGSPQATRIDYSIWATLTGPLAELPPRQIESALHELADDFFAEFCAVIEAKHGKRPNRAGMAHARRQHVFLRPISLAGLGRRSAALDAPGSVSGTTDGTLVGRRGAHGMPHRPSSPQAMPVWAWGAAIVFVALVLYALHWLR